MSVRSQIIGTGSCLPKKVLSNHDLEKMVDTSDEWITTRTGIKNRRIAVKGEETSKLAAGAAHRALEMAGLGPNDLDMIVVGTVTPDMTMPSCACLLQKELGAEKAFAFDINAACSGFLFALDLADKYIRVNPTMHILVVGAETLSTRTNWQDRNTCVLFGDGAGAAILTGNGEDRGVVGSQLYSDGRLWELLSMEGAAGMNPDLARENNDGSYIRMSGKDVFKHAVRSMGDAVSVLLNKKGIAAHDLSLVVPHQANIRILNSLAERLGIPLEKVYINMHKYGNTSAASLPIALDEANREGRLTEGDTLLLCAFGGGFTWGAAVINW